MLLQLLQLCCSCCAFELDVVDFQTHVRRPLATSLRALGCLNQIRARWIQKFRDNRKALICLGGKKHSSIL